MKDHAGHFPLRPLVGGTTLHCVCEDATRDMSWGHFESGVQVCAQCCLPLSLSSGTVSNACPTVPLDALLGSFQLPFSALGMHPFSLPTHTLVPQS